MFYFQHFLAQSGVVRLARVSILRTGGEDWVHETLHGELRELHPEAEITVDDEADLTFDVDLLVVPLTAAYEFPLQDVVYAQLDVLERAQRVCHRARHVMIYRARWREVEVVAAAALPGLVRRRRIERWLIGVCRRSPLVRRLLHPRYPN
jgi:hypothetical protein